MIYLHYFILFGLSLITVAMKFIDDAEAHPRFAGTCMYLGFALFYIGLAIANYYNKVKVNKTVVSIFINCRFWNFLVLFSVYACGYYYDCCNVD